MIEKIKDIDLTGRIFGKWTVLERVSDKGNVSYWKCQCFCGNENNISCYNLLYGSSTKCKSCRTSIRNTKHGMRWTNEYNIWCSMLARCTNENLEEYKNYGGRGITVCDEWLESFENFYRDMGDKPEGLSIDRIDNDGNYEPGNCKWSTPKEQANNRRKPRKKELEHAV